MKKKEATISSYYYLNEYSLRGQFANIEEFSRSMQNDTLPLLNKIKQLEGAIFLKTDFWQAKICPDCSIFDLSHNKTKRYAVSEALKVKISKLLCNRQYWDEEQPPSLEIESYDFDKDYCANFDKDNCFLRALYSEGNIVSFWHAAYQDNKLSLDVKRNGKVTTESLLNLACEAHWPKKLIKRQWFITGEIRATIRLAEPESHTAHFHVECEGYAGSFELSNGNVLEETGNVNLRRQIHTEVKRWHATHLHELMTAWRTLHGNER